MNPSPVMRHAMIHTYSEQFLIKISIFDAFKVQYLCFFVDSELCKSKDTGFFTLELFEVCSLHRTLNLVGLKESLGGLPLKVSDSSKSDAQY